MFLRDFQQMFLRDFQQMFLKIDPSRIILTQTVEEFDREQDGISKKHSKKILKIDF